MAVDPPAVAAVALVAAVVAAVGAPVPRGSAWTPSRPMKLERWSSEGSGD